MEATEAIKLQLQKLRVTQGLVNCLKCQRQLCLRIRRLQRIPMMLSWKKTSYL